MRLLIKGMDMPKHAIKSGTDDTLYWSCIIVHPDGTAELIVDTTFADMFSFEHCLKRFPLAEIPTPHGDLIDRDYLLNSTKVLFNDVVVNQWSVINAPTIIKAEE
nr:hypothetical protein [uncultured Ruminococcus sp.]